MGNYHADNDTAEARYKDRVSRRLLRSRDGLSITGCIGLFLAILLAILAYEVPAHPRLDKDVPSLPTVQH
jgi:hypothetical protein